VIGSDGIIRADAGTTGDGGRVIVWSDESTKFFGSISARGGAQSGNGGFVETSGRALQAFGSVDTRAPNGSTGNWLLDPTDITISANGAALPICTAPIGSVSTIRAWADFLTFRSRRSTPVFSPLRSRSRRIAISL